MHKSFLSAFIFLLLSGCAGGLSVLEKTLPLAFQKDYLLDSDLKLANPNFEYLLVSLNGRQAALLAKGVTAGSVEVFFSKDKEIIYLQHGHVIQTAGLQMNWQNARFSHLDHFEMVLQQSSSIPIDFVVQWDEMPEYRFGRTAKGKLQMIPAPQSVKTLKFLNPGKLIWFEETFEQTDSSASASPSIPPIRFAVDLSNGKSSVVFSEQCLSTDFCLSLQRWPVRAEQN